MRAMKETMAPAASLGRVIPGVLTAAERDSEREIYSWVRALAAESPEAGRFCERLRLRVAAGRMSYGEAWRERDNISEAIDELCGFVAYLLFEGVRRGAGQRTDAAAAELGLIAQEAACLAVWLRRLARRLEAGEERGAGMSP